ncbi:Com family DNA-binding transcriptional regulator [Sulfurimicrobium lacus]|uniref:Com family DNA-binding transcriptional regulator n=1 Tax=Sulfurimicrobium lacus TaxID=2715678 RepID=UPI001FCF272D|nr:Com family DNA-binding transcriptional regulator [Sulfurimicrobium lacus]
MVRCGSCNRKLAEAEYIRLSIKCPRCGAINQMKASEPLISAARPPDLEAHDGKLEATPRKERL